MKIAGEGRLQEILLQKKNITQLGTSLFSLFPSAFVDDIQMAGRQEDPGIFSLVSSHAAQRASVFGMHST